MNRAVAAIICCLLVGTAGAAGLSTQSGSFTVAIADSIDTPSQEVTIDGDSYTVDSIARISQGEELTVRTDGPDDESYRVYIHSVEDGSRSVYDTKYVPADGSRSVSFDTSSFEAGSYVVSIYHDGTYYDPHPLAIPAYDVTVSVPDSVAASGTLEISPSLTEVTGDETVDSVEVVVTNDDTTRRLEATKSDESYVADLDLDSIPTGDYQVHAVVYGPESTPGATNEVIGISDATELTIEAESASTTSGGTGGSSTTSTSSESTTDATPTGTTAGTTDRETTASSTTQGTTPASTTESTPQSTTDTTDESSSSATVITPGTEASPTTPSDSNGVVGGTPLYLLALLASIALLLRS